MDTTLGTGSTDDELLVAVANGDTAAFAELYDRFAPHVFGRAQTRLADPLAAQDLTREVFLEFWRQAPALDRGAGSVAEWLYAAEHAGPSSVATDGRAAGF